MQQADPGQIQGPKRYVPPHLRNRPGQGHQGSVGDHNSRDHRDGARDQGDDRRNGSDSG